MGYWDVYNNRININGDTKRERDINRLKQNVIAKAPNNPSYKSVKLNNEETYLMINSDSKPYYKKFTSLPDQEILAGDYVEWANNIWLVYESDCDDEVYTDGTLRQCQYELFWQKADGTIVSRYAWVQNASAYNNGETGNNTITLQSNQFMVYMTYDEESALLDNGIRIHMSRSDNLCRPYALTRPDDITYGYGEKGILNIIFTQSQFDKNKDKLVTLDNGANVWICDYHSSTPPNPPDIDNETHVSSVISGNKSIKVGYPRIYQVTFKDENENVIEQVDFKWVLSGDFTDKISINEDGHSIKLYIDNEGLIGESFLLQVLVGDKVNSELKITIDEFL